MKENLTIPLAIVIAGAIIAGAVFYNKSPKDTVTDKKDEPKVEITSNDHILGNPDAELTIVEYSDIECPFCKRFHVTMHQIMDEYGKDGKVNWVYRHFPLDQIHDKARKEAEATECANELGGNEKFWAYLDKVYELTPSNNGLDLKELPKIAESIGLDVNKFNECLSSGKFASKIEESLQSGIKLGVSGTPLSIIVDKNGKKTPINGALPFAQIKALIDQALVK